jgi:hypothetical protein
MGLKPIFFVGICIPLAKANGNMKNQIKYYWQTEKGTLVPLKTAIILFLQKVPANCP